MASRVLTLQIGEAVSRLKTYLVIAFYIDNLFFSCTTISCSHSFARQFLNNFRIPFFNSDFIDVDECKEKHSCHEHAKCINTIGSHACNCQRGFTGNGQNCTGEF